MAMSPDEPGGSLLTRAGQALRELPEPGWQRIAEQVITAVRATPRSAWSLAAADPDPAEPPLPGGITVSDLVVRGALARALRRDDIYAATAIDLTVEDAALRRVHIEITGHYGTHLATVADRVRTTAAAVLDDVLGARSTPHLIDIVITDIVAGHPLHD